MPQKSNWFTRNILVCHACPVRQQQCMGRCACLADGRDIIDHATEHNCPQERFAARGLGDSLAWFLERIGVHRLMRVLRRPARLRKKSAMPDALPCGCAQRREKLNSWIGY